MDDMGAVRFTTTLQRRGPAAAVVLDEATVDEVGRGAKRFPVVATVNGYTWRTSVTRMGGEFLLGLSREVRQGAGVEAGDDVEVRIEGDDGPRDVEIPAALAEALNADKKAKVAFAGLAPSHRKEYCRWIGEAKREETKVRRAQQALELIRQGKSRT
jgi:antitoxin component of MazEF toxin-antitoxin module